MTELAAGYPAQRADSDETLTDIGASGSIPAVVEPASDSPAPGESRISEAVDKVGDVAGDVAETVGDAAERAAAATGRIASQVVDRLRNEAELAAKTAEVNLTIVIEFGYVVYSVTEKVRAKVISAIENLLGLEVTTVDILVDDVHVSDEALAAKPA